MDWKQLGEVAKRPISAQCKAELSGGWTCSLRIGQISGSTSKTTIITIIIIIIICLPIQETQVQSLVQEDPICQGAIKPMNHNYRVAPTYYN